MHIHHALGPSAQLLSWARLHGLPTLLTLHTRYDLHLEAYTPRVFRAVAKSWMLGRLRAAVQACDQLVVPAGAALDWTSSSEGAIEKMVVVPNGIDLATIRGASPARRQDYGCTADDVILLHTGRLAPEKDLGDLLVAFALLRERSRKKTVLIIAGDGPSRRQLERNADRRDLPVVFLGNRTSQEVAAICKMADLFVTPSVSEVHPLSVMEALASGLPVVGFEGPGLRDIVSHLRTGLLTQRNVEKLASAMLRLVDGGDVRRQMSAQARSERSTFDSRGTAGRLLDCYATVLERTRGSFIPCSMPRKSTGIA